MDKKPVPYIVYETELARMERQIKRMFVLCLIIFLALIGTNAGWIAYEKQYEDSVTTVTQDVDTGDGGDTTIIGIGGNNGESETDSNCQKEN